MAATPGWGELPVIAVEDAGGAQVDRRKNAIPDAAPQDWTAADAMVVALPELAIRYGERPGHPLVV